MLNRFRRSPGGTAESGFVSPIVVSRGFRADIEGMRGVAVLLVVLYHVRVPGFEGGFIGVDVFFVLSGYLITGLLVREIERTGQLNLWEFYARRARRLLPASALVLVATVAAGMAVFSPIEQTDAARSAFAAATYMSNMWFAFKSADYFAASSETNPLLHTWSLSVEEQFYVVWPLLILLALGTTGRRGRLLLVMAGLSLISLAGSLWLTETRQAWAFYGAPARAWEFGVGGLASLLSVAVLRDRPGATRILGWFGLTLILLAAIGFTKQTTFPGIAALVPVLGTVAVLVAGAGAPGAGVGRLLTVAPLQRFGQLSYSWYLWHWPVLVITAAAIPTLGLAGRVLCGLASLGLAAATYALVENPIRFNRHLVARPAYSLGLAALLTVSAGGISLGWRHSALQARVSPMHHQFEMALRDHDRLGTCNASWGADKAVVCVFGDTTSTISVVLFGDSHAAHWFPAFEPMAREQGWRLVSMIKQACPAAALPVVDRRYHEPNECSRWRADAMEHIRTMQPDLVVLGSAPAFYPGATYDDWRSGFEATLGAFNAATVPALVLWGAPSASEHLPACLSRAVVQRRDPNVHCALDPSEALDSTSFLAALHVAATLEGVVVADLSDHFCDGSVCKPIVDGAVLLHDSHHLTATRARSVTPVLTDYVTRIRAATRKSRFAEPVGTSETCKGPDECIPPESSE